MTLSKNIQLGDVAKVISGYAFKSSEFGRTGVPVIKIANIRVGYLDLSDSQFVDPSYIERLNPKFQVLPGDILISLTGSQITQPNSVVGRVAKQGRFVGPCLLNQRAGKVMVTRPDKCDSGYLFWTLFVDEARAKIAAMAHGAASQANVSPGQIESLEIRLPQIGVQKRIASILSAYDDLIENNTRRMAILEEMARRVYEEWFVKFRFPGHQHARFTDSPLGRIPEGWKVTTLSKLVTIDKGISYKGEFLTDDGIPMVNLKCIPPGGGFNRNGTKPYSGEHKSRHRVVSGDLVFANTDITQAGNIIGSPGLVPRCGFDQGGLASHHICIVRVSKHSPVGKIFLFHLLQSGGFRDHAKGCASGTTVLGLRSDDALVFEFVLPPQQLTQRFEQIAVDLYKLDECLNDRNTNLRTTRDLLLPKLISGEIDVSAIGAVAEKAVAA
jgi:type I restriction enzyme S subunit